MQNRIDWDMTRWVLAIARAGSLAGAARTLNVSHATVFRRLNAFERELGVALFTRAHSGYTPTVAGEAIISTASDIESRIYDLEHRVLDGRSGPTGRVRVTTTDTLFAGPVAPMLTECRHEYPSIHLETAISNAPFDLSRRQADMAIRPMASPPDALIAYRLGTIAMAPYRAIDEPNQASTNPVWLGPDDSVFYPALTHWLAQRSIDTSAWRLDSLLSLAGAVRHGAGRAVLPCYLGDPDAALCRCEPPIETLAMPLWLLIHPDLRRAAPVRAIRDRLIEAFAADMVQARLTGQIDL